MTANLLAPARVAAVAALLFFGAIFGFFYAWVCSTMWGLDATDPRIAITAMQAMNESVRNVVFYPAFFLTPVIALVAGGLAWSARRRRAAVLFAVAGVLYLLGGIVFTAMFNLPLNEELAEVVVPDDPDLAREIWRDYSSEWQVRNLIRTVLSGLALLLASLGALSLGSSARADVGQARS